jgi:hypothetical protein
MGPMIANSAFLAAMVLVLLTFVLIDQLAVLAPYRRFILRQYGWHLVGLLFVVFINLFALLYTVSRRLFLKDSGRKLAHVEHQLLPPQTIAHDLTERLGDQE